MWGVSRKETHRICAPGGFATAPAAADVEREETVREGASESDYRLKLRDMRRFVEKKFEPAHHGVC